MRTIVCILFIFSLASCATQNSQANIEENTNQETDEWQVQVFDSQYDVFLNTRARPREYYTEQTLKNRNTFLVNEWNSRVIQPNYRNDIYQNTIQYNPKEEYGFEFEYKLYQAFVYVSWRYGEKFSGISKTEWWTQ